MKWFLLILATSLLQLAQALTVEVRHTHGVFYPDLKLQAVAQLMITGEPGEKIKKLEFSGGKASSISDIQMARHSTSGSWNGYTINTTATGKVYSPAKRERARKKIQEKTRELYEALLSINDEETAENFGEDVLELCEDIHELDRICEADEQVLNHLYNALEMPERERIAFHLYHLLRDNYGAYDEDLRKAHRKYLDIPTPH